MFALCSGYGTIKAESFEKEVLMLSSTERVFSWNKYFDHLKKFILLATDSVSMQAFFFFDKKKKKEHLSNEGCVQESFWLAFKFF